MKILMAVDGSKHSMDAVNFAIRHAELYREKPGIELVYIHPELPKLPRMGMVVSKEQIQRYYEEEGEAHLAPAKERLNAAGVPFSAHVLVGSPAETIVRHASDSRCDMICLGTRGMNAAAGLLLGSVTTKVLHLATLPVLLVK